MARIVLSLPIRRTADNVLTANTSPRLEVFRTATYATASGSSSTALAVAERGGLSIGDDVYVGTNAAVAISNVTSTGAGAVTLASALSWSNNDAVVVKRKTGASTDAYATIYDDPDFATAITQTSQAFVADANNVWTFFAKPGRYGVRYSNSSNTTLRLDAEVNWDEVSSVQVTPAHDSTTGGIAEAINKLPTTGGKVYLAPGTYTMSAALTLSKSVSIQGSGAQQTFIKLSADTNGIVALADDCSFSDFTIYGNVANSNALITVGNGGATAYRRATFERVHFATNSLYHAATGGVAILLNHTIFPRLYGVSIGNTTAAAPIGDFKHGIVIDWTDACNISHSNISEITSTAGYAIYVRDTNGPTSGLAILSPDFAGAHTCLYADVANGANNIFMSGAAAAYYTTFCNLAGAVTAAPGGFIGNFDGTVQRGSSYYLDGMFVKKSTSQTLVGLGAGSTTCATQLLHQYRNNLNLTVSEVNSVGGATPTTVLLTATPTLAAGADGQELTICNADLYDATQCIITLQDNATLAGSNLYLRTTTLPLHAKEFVHLKYFSTSPAGWYEVNRRGPQETSGTATIIDTATTAVVTHGLGTDITPSAADVVVTATNNPTNALTTGIWVDTFTNTQFTIHRNNPGVSTATFAWRARRP